METPSLLTKEELECKDKGIRSTLLQKKNLHRHPPVTHRSKEFQQIREHPEVGS